MGNKSFSSAEKRPEDGIDPLRNVILNTSRTALTFLGTLVTSVIVAPGLGQQGWDGTVCAVGWLV